MCNATTNGSITTCESKRTLRRGRRGRRNLRRGGAVIECAFTAPLLIIILFGTLDVGQFVNISQSVSNASRMGSRTASRQDTATAAAVETKVKNYLFACGIPRNGVTVTVSNDEGQQLTNLTTIKSGDPVKVQVSVAFASTRKIKFLPDFTSAVNASTSTMRRE